MSFEIPLDLLGAGAALAVSIYNFWKSRQPGKLVLGDLVEIGGMLSFHPMTRQEHLLLYLPLHFFNEGNATAMITDIQMRVSGSEGPVEMYLMKRVEGQTVEEIKSIQPAFPIFVQAGAGIVATFEFMDGAETAMKLDQPYEVTLTVTYNMTRSVSRTYALHLSREEVSQVPKLSWIHLHRKATGAPPPIRFGKDL